MFFSPICWLEPFLRSLERWLLPFFFVHVSPRSAQLPEPRLQFHRVPSEFFEITNTLAVVLPLGPSLALMVPAEFHSFFLPCWPQVIFASLLLWQITSFCQAPNDSPLADFFLSFFGKALCKAVESMPCPGGLNLRKASMIFLSSFLEVARCPSFRPRFFLHSREIGSCL